MGEGVSCYGREVGIRRSFLIRQDEKEKETVSKRILYFGAYS